MDKNLEFSEADTKTKIFLTAARLFSVYGYDRVSIRQICESVGVGKPTLYYYFKDKENLLAELIQYSWNLGEQLAEEYIPEQEPFPDRLYGVLKLHQTLALRHPDFGRFFIALNLMNTPDSIKQYTSGLFEEKLSRIRWLLEQGRNQGFIDPDVNIDILLWTITGTINHLSIMNIFHPELNAMSDENLNKLFEFWKTHLFKQPNTGERL